MYLCPVCKKQYKDEETVIKHSLKCWRAQNSNHVSTSAPRGPDVVEREINDDIADFFEKLRKEKKQCQK